MSATIEFFYGYQQLAQLPCLRLRCQQASAVLSLYGAQVLSYSPSPTKELLYLSPSATWQNNTAIRGGIPICWPWFGPSDPVFKKNDNALPNHGLVRTKIWQLSRQECQEHLAKVTLNIQVQQSDTQEGLYEAELTVALTQDELALSLRSNHPLQQGALHTYLNVASVQETSVSPLPMSYQDNISQKQVQDKSPTLFFKEEVDRIYPNTAQTLVVSTGDTTLSVIQQGHDASVLWNPWIEKAKRLNDLPDTGYLDFVCVETARLNLQDPTPLCLTQRLRYLGHVE